MHAFRAISPLILIFAAALVAANPLLSLAERQSCHCQSPSGCPGHCAPLQGSGHSYCIGYCARDNAVICDACGFSSANCIVNDDGSCFTIMGSTPDRELATYLCTFGNRQKKGDQRVQDMRESVFIRVRFIEGKRFGVAEYSIVVPQINEVPGLSVLASENVRPILDISCFPSPIELQSWPTWPKLADSANKNSANLSFANSRYSMGLAQRSGAAINAIPKSDMFCEPDLHRLHTAPEGNVAIHGHRAMGAKVAWSAEEVQPVVNDMRFACEQC
ncbi:hypothetical protein C8J57DRAFT_1226731 [Mycena rebaudengoi]|nr:hypothetical protein C8J57DRAFT_1226731 [Mycena rebaudengoi]